MSVRLYTFRITKALWWDTLASIRGVYLAEYPIAQAMTVMANALIEKAETDRSGDIATKLQMLSLLDTFSDTYTKDPDEGWSVEFQVFDEGDTWLIRPLERGSFLLGRHERWPELQPVFYDTRTDEPSVNVPANRATSEWVDEQIKAHRYFVVPVLSREDYRDIGWGRFIGTVSAGWPGATTDG